MTGGQHAGTDAATRAHFTARATQYSGGSEASLQAMLELASPRPGERALDVATGTGLVLFALAGRVGPGGLAVGVDFTPAMLAEAARRPSAPGGAGPGGAGPGPQPGAALIAAHATQLPFRPGSFDVVTCRFAVHHFSDPGAGLGAMVEALRPGGRLVIADFICPEDPAAAELQDRLERLRGHVYVQIFTQSRLQEMLAAAGCPVRAVRPSAREMRPQEWLASPNVSPESRVALAELINGLTEHGGTGSRQAGLEVRRVDGEVRLVRTDAVLLGIKSG